MFLTTVFGVIPTVTAAAKWVINNSAAIGDAFKAVKNVAGGFTRNSEDGDEIIFIAHPEAADDLDPSKKNIADLLDESIKRIQDEADKVPGPDGSMGRSTANSQVSGLWLHPSNAVGGVPSQEMYREVAQHLSEEGYPMSFIQDGGNTVDVPYRLAQAVFANSDKGKTVQTSDETRLIPNDFNIDSAGGNCKIQAKFVHYILPLGKEGTDDAWHGTLRANRSWTKKFAAEQEKEQQSRFYISDAKPPSGPVWVLTCEIDWKTVIIAKQGHQKLGDELYKTANYYVSMSNLEATIQIVKLVVGSDISPAQIRAYVEVKTAEIARGIKTDEVHLLDASTEPLMGQSPTVFVKNSSFRGYFQTTSDYLMAYNRHLESKKRAAEEKTSMQEAEMIDVKDCGEMDV